MKLTLLLNILSTDVIEETPKSKLVKKPTSSQRLKQKRNILREIKQSIQNEMDENGDTLVLRNRISWSAFDKIRKQEGLEMPKDRKQSNDNCEQTPVPKRKKHGFNAENIPIDTTKLLEEAQSWGPNSRINWTELGAKYGLTIANRGQVIKEFLSQHNIPAARTQQRPNRVPRRSKKKLPGGQVSFPMHQPVHKQKQKVANKVTSGEIQIGRGVVQTSYSSYAIDPSTLSISETTKQTSAREIPIIHIRQKLLEKHEKLGIIRNNPDNYFASLSEEDTKSRLTELGEYDSQMTIQEAQHKLKSICRTRHFKVWHDHSEIAGHSHLLVLVSAVYDPAFYFTSTEMSQKGVQIDVPTIVETPEVHILGKSSSLEDQRMFTDCCRDSLSDFSETIHTSAGIPVNDIVRFFHGDGPAQQFEASNKIGGYHCCVGCDAHSTRFDDLTYCFRSRHLTLSDRQEFLLEGERWKHNPINPLSKLKVAELRTELSKRGVEKPQLQEDLDNLQRGISNFPALIQHTPQASLDTLGLQLYEVFPSEPLHDLKGHFSNIIDEALNLAPTDTKAVIHHIKQTALNKSTLRASDYPKAVILIYNNLLRCDNSHPSYKDLFQTATEISEILYSPDSQRSSTTILRLHNVTFIHGRLCTELFGDSPRRSTIFGRYFHSIVTHVPLLYRIIPLCSVNTEMQERVFGQAKQITKATSNQKPDHVINNILIRIQEEAKANATNPLTTQESEIGKLAQALPSKTNTIIPHSWARATPTQYQAHLERISDYLKPGPSVWWKATTDGIEFFDSGTDPSHMPPSPQMMHYRSTTLLDVDLHLQQVWEECTTANVTLPASIIHQYTSDGTPITTTTSSCETSSISQSTSSNPTNSTLATLDSTIPASLYPTTPASVDPTIHASLYPTTPASVDPTIHASLYPTTPASVDPTIHASLYPTTPASVDPTIPASLYPTTPASVDPTIHASLYPTTPASVDPTIPASLYPTTPASVDPTIPASLYPTTPTSVDPTIPAKFGATTPLTLDSIIPATMTASSLSVPASNSTDVLYTTSAASVPTTSIQTPNRVHSTDLKTSLAQTL